MIKSLEVVIALSLLFLFVIFIIGNYQEPNTDLNILKNNISDIMLVKAKNTDFRDLVASENIAKIYDSFYEQIDASYTVELCDWINNNCTTYNSIPSNKTVIAYDYYFYDINKTLSVISWIM